MVMTGLGESNYPTITDIRPHTDAVGFLRDTLLHTPHVSVIALGPLTNLARPLSDITRGFCTD